MPTRVEVSGLSQAKENFEKLDQLVQKDIGRQSLRAQGWTLARPMRGATYTTFVRRTGAIRAAMGVVVAREPKDNSLVAYVEELPTKQPLSPFGALLRKNRRRTTDPAVPFYWRFLEFGTNERRSVRTPKALRSGRVGRTGKARERTRKQLQRWLGSGNRGAVASRSWLRPVFGPSAPRSVEAFRETIVKLIDAAVSAMSKK
jgi:hypothetical protein